MKVGCWKDVRNPRTMEDLEPLIKNTRGHYLSRANPIPVCFLEAIKRGYKVFAIQDRGQCFASKDFTSYKKHGTSLLCTEGKGGSMLNDVYKITGAC